MANLQWMKSSILGKRNTPFENLVKNKNLNEQKNCLKQQYSRKNDNFIEPESDVPENCINNEKSHNDYQADHFEDVPELYKISMFKKVPIIETKKTQTKKINTNAFAQSSRVQDFWAKKGFKNVTSNTALNGYLKNTKNYRQNSIKSKMNGSLDIKPKMSIRDTNSTSPGRKFNINCDKNNTLLKKTMHKGSFNDTPPLINFAYKKYSETKDTTQPSRTTISKSETSFKWFDSAKKCSNLGDDHFRDNSLISNPKDKLINSNLVTEINLSQLKNNMSPARKMNLKKGFIKKLDLTSKDSNQTKSEIQCKNPTLSPKYFKDLSVQTVGQFDFIQDNVQTIKSNIKEPLSATTTLKPKKRPGILKSLFEKSPILDEIYKRKHYGSSIKSKTIQDEKELSTQSARRLRFCSSFHKQKIDALFDTMIQNR